MIPKHWRLVYNHRTKVLFSACHFVGDAAIRLIANYNLFAGSRYQYEINAILRFEAILAESFFCVHLFNAHQNLHCKPSSLECILFEIIMLLVVAKSSKNGFDGGDTPLFVVAEKVNPFMFEAVYVPWQKIKLKHLSISILKPCKFKFCVLSKFLTRFRN